MQRTHRLLWHALLALIVFGSTRVLAQAADHDVRVRMPEIIGIRLLGGGSGIRSVTFDYAAAPEAYLSALESGGSLPPTEVVRFDGIEVNASRNGRWYVEVVASPLAYTGSASMAGLTLEDLRVDRGAVSGLVQDAIVGPGKSAWYLTSWTLSSTARQIASRTGATGGWRSLGFDGTDYVLTVDGDEAAGTYTTTVTYFLTAP